VIFSSATEHLVRVLKRLEVLNKQLWKPLLRLLFRNRPHDGPVDPNKVKKVLILRLDRLGDMIVSTPLFRALKKRLPSVRIGVFGGPQNLSILEFDSNITWKYRMTSNPLRTLSEALRARKENYDVIFNLNLNPSLTGSIIANVAAPGAIKVMGVADPSTMSFYNMALNIQRDYHTPMVSHLLSFLEVFGMSADQEDVKPYISLGNTSEKRTEEFMKKEGLSDGGFIILNPFAGERRRDMGEVLAKEVALQLSAGTRIPIVILWAPGRDRDIQSIAGGGEARVIKGPSGCSILEASALIGRCLVTVSPDTSIIHIADALEKPVVVIYSKLVPSFREWYPRSIPCKTLYAERYVSDLTAVPIVQATLDLLTETGTDTSKIPG
jgi:ADP-heptose:LPS heptosyltransferase